MYGAQYEFEAPGAAAPAADAPGIVTLTCLLPSTFEARVFTSDVPGNGTDGHIYIALETEQGVSPEHRIYSYNYNGFLGFDRGGEDALVFEQVVRGTLQRLVVSHRLVLVLVHIIIYTSHIIYVGVCKLRA